MEICTTTVSKPENHFFTISIDRVAKSGEKALFHSFLAGKMFVQLRNSILYISFYSKCRIAHILIRFFISTQTSKHKAKSFCNQ